MMAPISLDELHTYHAIDREIFTCLVVTYLRNPAESLLVMATWMWLEEKGYPNIIERMNDLIDPLVLGLADEAALALKCLENSKLPLLPHGGMPLTTRIMGKNISLEMFLQNKYTAISGIKNVLNTICCRIFTDILEEVVGKVWTNNSEVGISSVSQPLVIPGFPHPLFGDITIFPRAVDNAFPTGGLWGWDSSNNIKEDDKTMFLTFSRGFCVTKEEVIDLFTNEYGENCVVHVEMQEIASSNEQPLFAKMIVDSIHTVDQILKGKRVSKFQINGKHIWARKYERRV